MLSVSASSFSPSRTPAEGSSGVDGTFASVARPTSSTETRSVNVPPTSMPMRYIGHAPSGGTPSPASGGGPGWGFRLCGGPSVLDDGPQNSLTVGKDFVVPEPEYPP